MMRAKLKVDWGFELRRKPQPADEYRTCPICGETFSDWGWSIERVGRPVICRGCVFSVPASFPREPGDPNPYGESDKLAYGPIGAQYRQARSALWHFKQEIKHARQAAR